jgi:hypothetical protein
MRTLSLSSNISRTSSIASHKSPGSFDPLRSHPPLLSSSSPRPIPEYEEVFEQDNSERDEAYRRLTHGAYEDSSPESSPSKDADSYLGRSRRRTYVYDQTIQWPLKDWQTIPPGLANMEVHEADVAVRSASKVPPTNHLRTPQEMSDMDMLVKRGDWKRRGIVFKLDENDEEQQMQHFELPE